MERAGSIRKWRERVEVRFHLYSGVRDITELLGEEQGFGSVFSIISRVREVFQLAFRYSTISRCKSQRLIAFWALKSCLVKIRVRGRILSKKQLQVSQGFLGERGLGKGSKTRATPWADEP